MNFPDYRARRLRRTEGLRRMVRETRLSIDNLCYPLFVIGGTGELYRGRRLVLRVLPPTTAAELAEGDANAPLPEPDTADERAAARRIAEGFAAAMAPGVADLHNEVERRSAGDSRRWPWLTHWLDWDADAADRAAMERNSSA